MLCKKCLFQCFFCPTEHELDSLCQLFRERIVEQEKQPLFEVCEDKPDRWSPVSKQDDLLGAWAQEGNEITFSMYMAFGHLY